MPMGQCANRLALFNGLIMFILSNWYMYISTIVSFNRHIGILAHQHIIQSAHRHIDTLPHYLFIPTCF